MQQTSLDPDVYDDKLYHEIQGWQRGVQIHKNPAFDPDAHPKLIIS